MAQAKPTLTRGPSTEGVWVGPPENCHPGEVTVTVSLPARVSEHLGWVLLVGCGEGEVADVRAGDAGSGTSVFSCSYS